MNKKASCADECDSTVHDRTKGQHVNLEILLEIGNIGSGHATTALSEIVRERIIVEVPRVHVVPPHLVPKIYGMHNQPMTVVYMQLRSEPSCDFLLAFEPEEVKNIAAIMTMSSSPDETSVEMEASAMQDLGSIMICSFLSAVADFADIKLVPAPPQLITDTFDALIDVFLSEQALKSETALIFDTSFKRSSSSAKGIFIVFPSLELEVMLVDKAERWLSKDCLDVAAIRDSC